MLEAFIGTIEVDGRRIGRYQEYGRYGVEHALRNNNNMMIGTAV